MKSDPGALPAALQSRSANGSSSISSRTTRETSDFIVDCLENWWEDRKNQHTHIRELVTNLDHGPERGSGRRQFIQRMIEFVDRYQLNIHLVYYPPHHRKYNSVEHVWGILKNHWNGTLLTYLETAIECAKTMTWKGISAIVKAFTGTNETGVKVGTKAFKQLKKLSLKVK